MAAHVGAEIRAGWCLPAPRGGYEMHYGPPIERLASDGPGKIAQKCRDEMEVWIRANPGHWL